MKISASENCGNLKELEELGRNKKNPYTIEQLLDENLKNKDGENRAEVTIRMEKTINKILDENFGKRVAIVSHGAALKFWLMKYCNLNKNNDLQFNNKIINLNSPGVLKLVFDNKKLISLIQLV